MLSDKNLKEIIKKYKIKIDEGELKASETTAKQQNKPLEEILLHKDLIDEEEVYKKAADFFDIEYVELKNKEIKKDVLDLIPSPVAGTHQVIAFEKDKSEIKLAMVDSTDVQTVEFLRR